MGRSVDRTGDAMTELTDEDRFEIKKQLRRYGYGPSQGPNWTVAETAYGLGVKAERERIRQHLLQIVTDHVGQGTDVVYDRLLVAIRELGTS